MQSRRKFLTQVTIGTAGYALMPLLAKAAVAKDKWDVPVALQKEMYQAALRIARKNIRGGPNDPVFKKPYLDAAFNGNIFLWDTCFMACYAKYHPGELPAANALDNFYSRQEPDGFICREYRRDGKAMWPKEHPVSINPPLFGFAELQLYSQSKDVARLKQVYPHLKKFFDFLVKTYRMGDHLFFSDALGSGMDNIPRYPEGWKDDGKGLAIKNTPGHTYAYSGLNSVWNKQGRSVDMTAQMALFADNLIEIAGVTGQQADITAYRKFHTETKEALNKHCWNEEDGFYYDLGYGKQVKRMHIGGFWTMIAGVVPKERVDRLVKTLTDPKKFWRKFPVPSYAADQKGYSSKGEYWLGGVWTPTNYMLIKGLQRVNKNELAKEFARKYYWCVAQVYIKTKTFWEDYAPDSLTTGVPAKPNFCGWTAVVPISIYHEFIE
ncbi:MAG TPA: trehalase family glycosidase [Mucilaginibacter sp.]|nr:trehalase family glycosidase [Mucilaginibacter sp.]